MQTPDEFRDPDLDWLGCEAMFSVPPFGLQPSAQQADPPARTGGRAAEPAAPADPG